MLLGSLPCTSTRSYEHSRKQVHKPLVSLDSRYFAQVALRGWKAKLRDLGMDNAEPVHMRRLLFFPLAKNFGTSIGFITYKEVFQLLLSTIRVGAISSQLRASMTNDVATGRVIAAPKVASSRGYSITR